MSLRSWTFFPGVYRALLTCLPVEVRHSTSGGEMGPFSLSTFVRGVASALL
jgi:hypothetical protein